MTPVAGTKQQEKVTYQDVADYFLALGNETGEPISNLKLQKLVYYAQAWHLANTSEPLFNANFQAWVHGPVIPELYHKLKTYGSAPIQSNAVLNEVKNRFDSNTLTFLEQVADVYMPRSAYELELMTHMEDPWILARVGLEPNQGSENTISEEIMARFYGAKIHSRTK
ncbi:MAG: type II toxin-antitoxin system antitoxin SocA domain-containing protein [Patescibacteria group bacterium]|jgi:uncharacterized phage-associated protein